MKKFLLPAVAGLFGIATSTMISNAAESSEHPKKSLVVYYSQTGNTKSIAEKIRSLVDGDIIELETEKAYPSDYNSMSKVAKGEQKNGNYPKLKTKIDISKYSVIYVGTPVWWGTMCGPIKSFMSKNKFNGKTVIPFITHGGGGQEQTTDDIRKIAKGAKVKKALVVYDKGDDNTQEEIKAFVKNNVKRS